MGAKGSGLGGRAGSGSLPNHEPNKENCYSEMHNRKPKLPLEKPGEL